jgi:hypothetical protein
LSDIPIQGKMLIAAVGPRWCQHREEMIYTCTYSEMRILQLIVSRTLANAGRPERVKNKNKQNMFHHERGGYVSLARNKFCHLRTLSARCLYNKVRYFRGFYVLVVGGAYVYNVRYQVSLLSPHQVALVPT